MATQTTGKLKLSKPAYNDNADVAVLNGDFDQIDAAVTQEAGAMAIVSDNNTHAAITSGQYVYVFNHSSLSQGLYKAKSNIAQNATLSTTNLQAVSSGGMNDLKSTIDALTALVEPHGTLPTNTDLNTVTTPGVYYCGSSNTYLNLPPSLINGMLIVHKASSTKVVQLFVLSTRLCRRIMTSNDGSWSDWATDEMHRGDAPSGALSSITDVGIYGIPAGTSYTDKPSTDAYIMLVLKSFRTNTSLVQITFGYNSLYYRYISGTTVRDWRLLAGEKTFSVGPSSSKTLTVENNTRANITFAGARDDACGILVISATSAGVISKCKLGADAINVTISTNAITIENTYSNITEGVFVQLFNGNVSEQQL